MFYEIAEIEEGSGDDDLLLTVHVWHSNTTTKPRRAPDFVYEHVFRNLPARPRIPRVVDGNFVNKVDGKPLSSYELTDQGAWARRDVMDPKYLDIIEWEDEETYLLDSIDGPIRNRIAEIRDNDERGLDLHLPQFRPKPRAQRSAAARARIASRRAFKGHRGRL